MGKPCGGGEACGVAAAADDDDRKDPTSRKSALPISLPFRCERQGRGEHPQSPKPSARPVPDRERDGKVWRVRGPDTGDRDLETNRPRGDRRGPETRRRDGEAARAGGRCAQAQAQRPGAGEEGKGGAVGAQPGGRRVGGGDWDGDRRACGGGREWTEGEAPALPGGRAEAAGARGRDSGVCVRGWPGVRA